MYSRQEVSKMRQEFWTALGQYLLPVLSSDGEKVNWINYKTGEKDIFFRMRSESKTSTVAIELTHRDPGVQQLYFEQLLRFRTLLEDCVGEPWQWEALQPDETGRLISTVSVTLQGPSLMNRQDWPELISFFKPRMIALDCFWNQVKYAFETLR